MANSVSMHDYDVMVHEVVRLRAENRTARAEAEALAAECNALARINRLQRHLLMNWRSLGLHFQGKNGTTMVVTPDTNAGVVLQCRIDDTAELINEPPADWPPPRNGKIVPGKAALTAATPAGTGQEGK